MNLYVSYYSADMLTRVNLDTLVREADLDLTPGGGGQFAEDCIVDGDYLYIARSDWPPDIVKIHLPTFAEVDRLVLEGIGSGSPHVCLCVVGNILYVAVDRPAGGVNGGIIRVNLTTFTRIDRLDLATRWPHITTDGTYLYVAYFIGTRIDRIPIATFAIDAFINMTITDAMAMYVYGNSLYITHAFGPGPDTITRIDIPTFMENANLVLGAGEAWGYALISDGTYLYCSTASGVGTPGYLIRINLATFTRIDNIVFPVIGGESDTWTLLIYNNFIWVLCETTPGSVVQVDIPTFTRLGATSLAPWGDSWSGGLFTPGPAVPFTINKAYALAREEL